MNQSTQTCTFDWQGLTLSVDYHPRSFLSLAHLVVRSVDPERGPLPITETGYRSHFLAPAEVDEAGGPVPYVLVWLDDAACAPQWQDHLDRARQGSLF